MFQKNLEAIKSNNPQLAQRLETIDLNTISGIEVQYAESKDLIISYKNTLLHSAIDPLREAKTIWNRTVTHELGKNDIQIVFGLGLGYLFKRAYVNAESKIFIIEPYIEVIRFVLEHVDFSAELTDKRVYITDNVEDIYNKLQKEYLSGDKVEFLFLNEFAMANQQLLQNLTLKTAEIVEGRANDENTIFNLSKFWTENFIKNISNFPEMTPLRAFEGKFAEQTALILSAGPSLADDIKIIKANENKFVTIAVGRAFRTLIYAGIIPDFVVFADALHGLGHVKDIEEYLSRTNVILLSKSDNYIFNLKTKSKILYFAETDSMSRIFEETGSINPGFYKSGSSVSIISYYIAKALGFANIAFSGLDLAFLGNKIYADGKELFINHVLYPESKPDDDYIEYFKSLTQNQSFLTVKDKEGNDLITRADYAWFIRQFGEILTEEINFAKVINTSLKGAYIDGMEYMALSELLKTVPEDKTDVYEIISSVQKDTKKDWDLLLKKIDSKLNLIVKDLKEINTDSNCIYTELNKIYTEYKNSGNTNYSQENFAKLNNKLIETRQKLVNNVFLSNSMQKQMWSYTKNYVSKAMPNKEEIIGNIERDTELFKYAASESSELIALLNTRLENTTVAAST